LYIVRIFYEALRVITQQSQNNSVPRTIWQFEHNTALLNQSSYCLHYLTKGSMDKEGSKWLPDIGGKAIAGEEGWNLSSSHSTFWRSLQLTLAQLQPPLILSV